MIINAIIAEYNPFHNGHLYQIEQSKKLTGSDYCIAIMSGNFVQRGTPALADKYTRAKIALKNGIDLVLELPSFYATGGAEDFAMGSISVLNKLNLVSTLCFGSESGDLEHLKSHADSILRENDSYNILLQEYLKQGNSYAKASELAQSALLDVQAVTSRSDANDRLAIEYLKALSKTSSNIVPFSVKRLGSGYHDTDLTNAFASASAIREQLRNGIAPSELVDYLPDSAVTCLSDYIGRYSYTDADTCSNILLYRLLSLSQTGFEAFVDVNTDLANKIKNHLYEYAGFSSFCSLLKSKNITYARISRALLHILTDYTKQDRDHYIHDFNYSPYVKVLGVRKTALPLLSALSQSSAIPLITQAADAGKVLDDASLEMFRKDTAISDYYSMLQSFNAHVTLTNEYQHKFLIVE